MDNGRGPEPVKYTIRVSKKSIARQIENGKEDKCRNVLKLYGKDFGVIRKAMERVEGLDIELGNKESVAYLGERRKPTPYLRIYAYCGTCRLAKRAEDVKYRIIVERDEYQREGDYVRVDVTRFGEHLHVEASEAAESTREERTVSIRTPTEEIKEEELLPQASDYDSDSNVYKMAHDLDDSIEPLMSVCSRVDDSVMEKHFNGICQQLELYPEFSMVLFAEQQLDCIKAVDVQHRVLQIHTSHSLFQLGPKYGQYDHRTQANRVFNYRCVLKDQSKLDLGLVKVAELIASSATSQTQSKFFILLKNTFESLHGPETLKFRLMVVDWSWTTIEAMLEAVNKLQVLDYAKLCYDLAVNKIRIDGPSSVSWLVTCADQTIKYFAQSLNEIGKKIGLTKAQHRNAMFCFGLLLTSTDLTQMSNYYRLICCMFLSPTCTEAFESAQQSLGRAFFSRAEFGEQLTDMIDKIAFAPSAAERTIFDSIDDQPIDTGHSDSVDALRLQSPFGRHFSAIRHNVEQELQANTAATTSQPNQYFRLGVIDLLNNHFMPYSFIWAGFVFQGMPVDSRLSNGIINNRRFNQSGEQTSIEPHKYVLGEFRALQDSCGDFMKDLLI